MAKKTLWAIAGLAVVVILVVVYFNGARSVQQGAEGTIGAAQRYRGAQPTGADVTLQKAEVQKFLQSDTFDKLMKDKAVRHMLSSKDGQKLLANELFVASLQRDQLAGAFGNEMFDAAIRQQELAGALTNEHLDKALTDKKVQEALADAGVRKLIADPLVMRALQDSGLAAVDLAKKKAAKKLQGTETAVSSAAMNRSLNQAMQNALFAELAANVAFRQAIGDEVVRAALAGPAFDSLAAHPQLFDALCDPALHKVFLQGGGPALIAGLGVPGAALALQNPVMLSALKDNTGLGRSLADQAEFSNALQQFDGEGLRKANAKR